LGFWLRFRSVTGFFKPAPSRKPRQKPKILAAHRYIFAVNALAFLLIVAALVGFIPVRAGAGTSLTISVQANIFGAGHLPPMDTPNPSGGSGGVPPVVFAFPPHQFRALTFTNVTGSVKLGNPCAPNGPDCGNFGYKIASYNGIAGIDAPVLGYLTGVFLDSNEPTDPPPAALNFSVIGTNFKTFSPQIGQVFFIGDGLTDQGAVQQFIVPPTATRLFLGLADSGYYSGGQLRVIQRHGRGIALHRIVRCGYFHKYTGRLHAGSEHGGHADVHRFSGRGLAAEG
jgi:hypothetical protein